MVNSTIDVSLWQDKAVHTAMALLLVLLVVWFFVMLLK